MNKPRLEETVKILKDMKVTIPLPQAAQTQKKRNDALDMAIAALSCSEKPNSSDCISRQAAIDALDNIKIPRNASWYPYYQQALTVMSRLPSTQPEIIHCLECEYGEQDEDGWWFCSNFGGAMGDSETGSGFCSDAERRKNERSD